MPRVLLVDDSAFDRNVLARLLRREGYETLTASEGREAISLLESGPDVDLIVLDIRMPEMDGISVLETIHAHPHWSKVPVVMLTGISDTHSVRRCEQLGARVYFVKATFSINEMLDHVRQYVAKSA